MQTQADTPASLRILVVDDHPDLLSMLDLMMQRRQYAVRTAMSASEALALAPRFRAARRGLRHRDARHGRLRDDGDDAR